MRKKYKIQRLGVTEVNFIALVLGLIFISVGSLIQRIDFFNGLMVNEFIIILFPAIVLLRRSNVKKVLKLNRLSMLDTARVILIVILFYPLVLLCNGLFLSFLSQFYELKDFSLQVMQHEKSLLTYIFYMAFIPCICEEVFFRGALMNAYEHYGPKFAVLCSAFIFALFHFDPQNLMAPFMLGILFGMVMEASSSLYAAFVAHFTNNVLAILAAKYGNGAIFDFLKSTRAAWEVGSIQFFTIIILVFLSGFSIFLIVKLYKAIKKDSNKDLAIQEMKFKYEFDIVSFWPILIMIIVYIFYLKMNFAIRGSLL